MSQEECYIAVHGGAGYHHPDHDKRTKRALRLACTKALQGLDAPLDPQNSGENRNDALTMVEQAIILLEDDPHLNAGYGSNLTLDGTVECDAAVFAAHSGVQFGSVGAASGIKNPISVARRILEYTKEPDKLGRVPPMTLVSQGAVDFAQRHGPGDKVVPPENMISEPARQTWKKWKDRLESSTPAITEAQEMDREDLLQDTVGAVAWHSRSGLAAGVSSGGILLKLPGRIGEAAVFGAGCWAEHRLGTFDGVACSISGTGEQIIRANLARRIGEASNPDADFHEFLQRTLADKFWNPAKERGEQDPSAGVLIITRETDDDGRVAVRLWCAFTTASMAIAFGSSRDPQPKAYILRRPEGARSTAEKEPHVYITAFGL